METNPACRGLLSCVLTSVLTSVLLGCPAAPGTAVPDGGAVLADGGLDAGPELDAGVDAGTTLPEPDEPYTVTGTRYFVDPVNGDDARDGLGPATAWATLDHALATLEEGDAALLMDGNHGALVETQPRGRTGYVTVMAAEGASPVLTRISVRYPDLADAWLRFDGLRVEPEWVDPGADPQQPGANSSTYVKSAEPFSLERVRHLRLLRSALTGTNKYLTVAAARITASEDVLVSGVHARRTTHGIFMTGNTGMTVSRSLFHEGVASCIRIQPGNVGLLVDSVRCHDFNWDEDDDYCPRDGNNPHGSAVSIRSGDLTVRNSMFHDTPGVMLYDGDNGAIASYSNVLFENNAVYDINNNYPLRIYGLAENVVVRNNLLVGKHRLTDTGENTPDGRYRYNAAFMLHEPAPGYDASGLSLYNNVMVGAAFIAAEVDEHHNILWALSRDGTFTCDGGPETTVATCTFANHPTLFESGFFADPVSFTPGHDQTLEFIPSATSPALNAGDVGQQPTRSLGRLEAGFLAPTGPLRDASRHSVGPYER